MVQNKIILMCLWLLSPMIILANEEPFKGSDTNMFLGELYFTDKSSMKIAWDHSPDATPYNGIYEIQACWIDPSSNVNYKIITVPSSEINATVPRVRSGHFEYAIRFGVVDGVTTNYSIWHSSNSSNAFQTTSGTNGPWMVFWKLPPPSDITIE